MSLRNAERRRNRTELATGSKRRRSAWGINATYLPAPVIALIISGSFIHSKSFIGGLLRDLTERLPVDFIVALSWVESRAQLENGTER